MNKFSQKNLAALCAFLAVSVHATAAPAGDAAHSMQAQHVSQSSLAAKRPFAAIPASSPAVRAALAPKDLAGARKLEGKSGAFAGVVSKVYATGGIVILDFDPDYKSALTAVVKAPAFAQFPDLKTLDGKRVLVRGQFIDFHGKPEIDMTRAEQIAVVK
jgi:hypothetical protein